MPGGSTCHHHRAKSTYILTVNKRVGAVTGTQSVVL